MEDIVYAEGLEATVNEILIKISELCGVAFDYTVENTPPLLRQIAWISFFGDLPFNLLMALIIAGLICLLYGVTFEPNTIKPFVIITITTIIIGLISMLGPVIIAPELMGLKEVIHIINGSKGS